MSGLRRIPPGGTAIRAGEIARALRERDPRGSLRSGLARRLRGASVILHASGREALRFGLADLAACSGRSEVVVPAYTCFSVPAAVVAAGLRVRLVDVDLRGRIDLAALEKTPLDRAAAIVVSNLFGVPEPVEPVRGLVGSHDVAIIDDAAQCLGASSPEGPTGARGQVGLLSFGRGKPLGALGGGASIWPEGVPDGEPEGPAPQPVRGAVRAALFDLALRPAVFGALARIPALGVGETEYDPAFGRGEMDGAAISLAAALLATLDTRQAERCRRADRLAARLAADTRFVPLMATDGAKGAYPRLGALAPSAAARGAATDRLGHLGLGRLYPTTVDAIPELRASLVDPMPVPAASELCARLVTLPTHDGLTGAAEDRLVRGLAEIRE